MNLAELTATLRKAGVPDWFYLTDGSLGAGECLGIEQGADGWHIYYSERGRKSPVSQHASEAEACAAFLRAIDRMLREQGRPGLGQG